MRISALVWSGCLWGLCVGCASEAEVKGQQQQVAEQQAQAMRARATLDELFALVQREYRQQDYQQAKADIALLGKRYPHAKIYPQLMQLNSRLDSLAQGQQRREQTRQQRLRQANIPYPNGWKTIEYQDEFRKPAGRFYLTNAAVQWGEYSTPATDSARLAVRLLVDSSAAMHLVLYDQVPLVERPVPTKRRKRKHRLHLHRTPVPVYEYTTDYTLMHAVQVAMPTRYTVKVRDYAGQVHQLLAVNTSDRLTLDPASSRTLHALLLEGGEVNFVVTPNEQLTTTYRFTLTNADAYEAGYRELLRH